MDVYIFQAALYCERCGEAICESLTAKGKAPDDPSEERSYDSDDYPKGPYANGGGEADTPQHCDECQLFLENPLTGEGVQYVREAIAEQRARTHRRSSGACYVWSRFYTEELRDA